MSAVNYIDLIQAIHHCVNTLGKKVEFLYFISLSHISLNMTNVILCNIARHTTRLSATHLLLSPDGSRNLLANSTGKLQLLHQRTTTKKE